MALNKWVGMGRLARDPDLRHTQSGTPVVSFTIAVDRDFKSQGGERETDWIDIVAWRSTAEFVNKYFTKGSSIIVEGRLQIRSYTDKEGNKRKAAEIVADSVYFGGSKKESGGAGGDPERDYDEREPEQYDEPGNQFEELDDKDGELPF